MYDIAAPQPLLGDNQGDGRTYGSVDVHRNPVSSHEEGVSIRVTLLDNVRSSSSSFMSESQRSLTRRCSLKDSAGTATIRDEVFNLMKNIVGSVRPSCKQKADKYWE